MKYSLMLRKNTTCTDLIAGPDGKIVMPPRKPFERRRRPELRVNFYDMDKNTPPAHRWHQYEVVPFGCPFPLVPSSPSENPVSAEMLLGFPNVVKNVIMEHASLRDLFMLSQTGKEWKEMVMKEYSNQKNATMDVKLSPRAKNDPRRLEYSMELFVDDKVLRFSLGECNRYSATRKIVINEVVFYWEACDSTKVHVPLFCEDLSHGVALLITEIVTLFPKLKLNSFILDTSKFPNVRGLLEGIPTIECARVEVVQSSFSKQYLSLVIGKFNPTNSLSIKEVGFHERDYMKGRVLPHLNYRNVHLTGEHFSCLDFNAILRNWWNGEYADLKNLVVTLNESFGGFMETQVLAGMDSLPVNVSKRFGHHTMHKTYKCPFEYEKVIDIQRPDGVVGTIKYGYSCSCDMKVKKLIFVVGEAKPSS